MRASKPPIRTARVRTHRKHCRLRRLTAGSVRRLHDDRIPFHFIANDTRIDADEMYRLTTLEENRVEFMDDLHRVVLRSLRADPEWQKM